jgi:soluble lytic murein transglycosylase
LKAVARVLLLSSAVIFTLNVHWAGAQSFTPTDLQAIGAAFSKAHAGDWKDAYADLAGVEDPLPHKILRWLDDSRAGGQGRFDDIADFIAKNPDWPGIKNLRRRAEQASASEPDAAVAAWFRQYPPLSGLGIVRAAQIVADQGDAEKGAAALRSAWVMADLGAADERAFYAKYYPVLRLQDNWTRLDRLLWDGKDEAAARRMLPLVDPDHRALAETRLALVSGAGDADKLVARVPAALRNEPGLRYAELRADVKRNMTDAAVQVLQSEAGDPVRPELWWAQRQMIVRQVLATNPGLAWTLANQHGPLDGAAFAQAQFLLGFISLRYQKQPAQAFDHFSLILTQVSSPAAKARAGYWGGRAADAEGKPALAAKWYTGGAQFQGTFYGQLAAHQLGDDAPPHPVAEPVPTAAQQAHFDAEELVRVANLLFTVGDRDDAKAFLLHLTDFAKTPTDFAMLANLADRHGRTDLAIAVAQRAADAGLPLTVHGYPVTALPAGGVGEPEPSLLLAIVRQESAFAPDAVSTVGARGLMQLMPRTASYIAGKMALPFVAARLDDGVYNMLLGQAYLQQLIDDFGGSYALAIAAYNAGPGRVRDWVKDFGDPRGGSIDMVDWIELIPFEETRNYVQRVLENLQIYREQRGRNSAYTLVSDLAR